MKDLFDQLVSKFLAQRREAQQQAIVYRAEDRIDHQLRVCARSELAARLAALDVGDRRCASRANVAVTQLAWFNWGSAEAFGHLVGHLAQSAGAAAFVPDYRLAPEHPFPAANEDAQACYAALAADGARRIVLTGDSAGGNLALVLLSRSAGSANPPDGGGRAVAGDGPGDDRLELGDPGAGRPVLHAVPGRGPDRGLSP